MLTITIPLPVSLNNAYANSKNGGRFLTERAKQFKKDVAQLARIAAQESGQTLSPTARYATELVIHYPIGKTRLPDADNCHKLAADSICTALGIDDYPIDDIHIKRGQRVRGKGYAVFTISEIP